MSSYYPPGEDMVGSGIYSEDISLSFTCEYCDYENEDADGCTDDNGYEAYFTCEICGSENIIDVSME